MPAELALEHRSALAMFRAAVSRAPDAPLVHYLDTTLTVVEVDRLSDGLAAGLAAHGVGRGDRVALYLQNVPQYVLALLAGWKLGAIAVSVNPMWKRRGLGFVLEDSVAAALVSHRSLVAEAEGVAPPVILTTGDRDWDTGGDELLALAREHAGTTPPDPRLGPDDAAVLSYTSGTTGPPKGAINTHGNVVHNAQVYRHWVGLDTGDAVLGIAPLFHITGLIAGVAVSLLVPLPLVLFHRFEPEAALDAIERRRATFTVASITAFHALLSHSGGNERDLSSFTKVYSGGAPVAPATVEVYERAFGVYVHNIYGLTETTSPSHAVPFGRRAPVDPGSGALSVGVPVCGTVVRVLDEGGNELPPGEVGELATSGPGVVPGYWQNPEETAHALPGGELRTGDVGFMDDEGWFYLVDRKKDLINASGYKVWPREVEDVLYAHHSVREAAVVGVPDAYRGETVKAYVSLRRGEAATPEELIAFCKERLAAYKYPRQVELLAELPKTASGKILRRQLRDRNVTVP